MKPVAFEYERPTDMRAAISLLAQEGVFAKAIAGSQSLGPMLNLRLAQPDLLVDLTAIPEMTAVTETQDGIEIGACVTHANIEDGRIPDGTRGLLPFVAGKIAYRAVRNRGTIGGSIAHADPAADWISVFALLDAEAVVEGGDAPRSLAIDGLMISSFTTSIQPAELIRSLRIQKLSRGARWGYCKISQKAGEFAHAIGAVLHDPERGRFRAVIGAIESAPIVVTDAARLFGGSFGPDTAERVDAAEVLRLLDARGVMDEYSRRLLLVALKRAAKQASGS